MIALLKMKTKHNIKQQNIKKNNEKNQIFKKEFWGSLMAAETKT